LGTPQKQLIREYEKLREKEDIKAKAAVLAKRQEAAAAVEADLKAHATEEALPGAGDGDAAAVHCADTSKPLCSSSCVVVDISDIAIISVIPDMVKAIISGITNTPQKTYRIAK
jgi:hypothetical protein